MAYKRFSETEPKYIVTFWNGFDNQCEVLGNERQVIEFLMTLTPDFRERCKVYLIDKSIDKNKFLVKIDVRTNLGFNP